MLMSFNTKIESTMTFIRDYNYHRFLIKIHSNHNFQQL